MLQKSISDKGKRGFRGCCDMFPSNIHRAIDLATFTEMENKQPALVHGSINIGFERFMEARGQQRCIWSLVYLLLKSTEVFLRNCPKKWNKIISYGVLMFNWSTTLPKYFYNDNSELTCAFISRYACCTCAVGSRLFQGNVLNRAVSQLKRCVCK